jgi:hypothetical protein
LQHFLDFLQLQDDADEWDEWDDPDDAYETSDKAIIIYICIVYYFWKIKLIILLKIIFIKLIN